MSTCLLVTTMDRGPLLRQSLAVLADGDFTLPDEILVIDDGGTDDTEQVCREAAEHLPVRYIYHHNPGATLCSEARNVGLKLTAADIVITCEPEVYFQTDVIAQMLALHEEFPDLLINAGTVHKMRNGGGQETLVEWWATHCCLYRRDWLLEVGGWDESFPDNWGWDDTDLVTRLSNIGHKGKNDPSIVVVHQWHPETTIDQGPNSKHFLDKKLDHGDEHVVANKGTAWGQHRPRS